MEYPYGEVVSIDYLPQLLPYQLQSGLGNYANGVMFDEMGRMKEITLGSDLQTNLEYYQASDFQQGMQLKSSETIRLPGLSQVWKLEYTYLVGGDIHTQEDKFYYDTPSGGTTRDEYWTYAYDPIQRLSEAKMQTRDLVTGQLAQEYTVNLEYGFSQVTGDLASLTDHLNSANSVSYGYGDIHHKHAVTETNPAHAGDEYSYDANGNMLLRYENGIEYSQTWNAENRLKKVTWTVSSVSHEVSFTYDGDGTRVMRVVKQGEAIISKTIYIGGTYEKELVSGVVTKYYSLGGKTVAMRKDGVVTYLLSDHLGSNAMAIAANGAVTAARYLPYGQPRVLPDGGLLATDKTFTGQRAEEFGLMDFNARYYSPQLGRFISADSLIPEPGDPIAWDRYAYGLNNPSRIIDPSGHSPCDVSGADPECDPDYVDNWVPIPPIFFESPISGVSLEGVQWFGPTQRAYDLYAYDDDIYAYCQSLHCGLDLHAPYGTSVQAGVYGTVYAVYSEGTGRATYEGPYKIMVIVGGAGGYVITYGHTDGTAFVQVGDKVTPNTVISGVGNMGGSPTSGQINHIHLEVRGPGGWSGGVSINPLLLMDPKAQATVVDASKLQRTEIEMGKFYDGTSAYSYPPPASLMLPTISRYGGSYWAR